MTVHQKYKQPCALALSVATLVTHAILPLSSFAQHGPQNSSMNQAHKNSTGPVMLLEYAQDLSENQTPSFQEMHFNQAVLQSMSSKQRKAFVKAEKERRKLSEKEAKKLTQPKSSKDLSKEGSQPVSEKTQQKNAKHALKEATELQKALLKQQEENKKQAAKLAKTAMKQAATHKKAEEEELAKKEQNKKEISEKETNKENFSKHKLIKHSTAKALEPVLDPSKVGLTPLEEIKVTKNAESKTVPVAVENAPSKQDGLLAAFQAILAGTPKKQELTVAAKEKEVEKAPGLRAKTVANKTVLTQKAPAHKLTAKAPVSKPQAIAKQPSKAENYTMLSSSVLDNLKQLQEPTSAPQSVAQLSPLAGSQVMSVDNMKVLRSGVSSTVNEVDVTVNKAVILNLSRPAARVSISDPDIANAIVITPTQIQLIGNQVGVANLLIWGDSRSPEHTIIDIQVHRDVSVLSRQLKFVDSGIQVVPLAAEDTVILTGEAESRESAQLAVDLAKAFF